MDSGRREKQRHDDARDTLVRLTNRERGRILRDARRLRIRPQDILETRHRRNRDGYQRNPGRLH